MVERNNKMTIYERENGSIEVNFGIVGYEPLVLTPQYARCTPSKRSYMMIATPL